MNDGRNKLIVCISLAAVVMMGFITISDSIIVLLLLIIIDTLLSIEILIRRYLNGKKIK